MLFEILRAGAAAAPERPLVISRNGSMSYEEGLARSAAVARGLRGRSIPRFGCAVQDVADIVVALAGASAVGSEPCVYPRDLDVEGWSRFATRFGHSVIVTDTAVALPSGSAVALADLERSEQGSDLPTGQDAPVLILTTGTTGEPKGARHDWSRLVRSVRSPDAGSSARWLLTYNPNQFAGLQVLLHALVSQATVVVPDSRQPSAVIDAMREHGVTHVSATPTFWRLLVGVLDRPTADELSLQQITLGGEAAPDNLLVRLRALFPHARLSHVYAGTEFGSAVSVRDGIGGMPLSVLERAADADTQLRIVDGELHVRSKVGMLGYHQNVDADDQWRATGDLVEVRDGRVHFVGRTTEIINVGGAKIHPLPIEEIICAIAGVEMAAAYGRPSPVTGQIVAVDVVATEGVDTDALEHAIRAECAALPRAGRPSRIRFVAELEVRSNKLVRQPTERGT